MLMKTSYVRIRGHTFNVTDESFVDRKFIQLPGNVKTITGVSFNVKPANVAYSAAVPLGKIFIRFGDFIKTFGSMVDLRNTQVQTLRRVCPFVLCIPYDCQRIEIYYENTIAGLQYQDYELNVIFHAEQECI